jgi:hypothetical protein
MPHSKSTYILSLSSLLLTLLLLIFFYYYCSMLYVPNWLCRYHVKKKQRKTWRLSARRKFLRRSSWTGRIAFRLPHHDTPHEVPQKCAAFHVDRTWAVGGVFKQTNSALYTELYICRYYYCLYTETIVSLHMYTIAQFWIHTTCLQGPLCMTLSIEWCDTETYHIYLFCP